MPHDGYDAFDDPYAYKGSDVLKNRLGIRDADQLQRFELEMWMVRSAEPLPSGHFGAAHYRAIHRHLFQDVYAWAGRYRTVRTAKGGNVFCYPENIAGQMDRLFRQVSAHNRLRELAEQDVQMAATTFLAELNAIHPFREGNGRTQLLFLAALAAGAGRPLDLERLRPEAFLAAMIASFAHDLVPLERELRHLRV